MPDFRAYAPGVAEHAAEIPLTQPESHHLITVNRAEQGDPVVAFDGNGREWQCRLSGANRNAAVLRVESTRLAKPLPCAVTLAQAVPKGATMDDIVRQATEIGAARIAPLLSERTQVHLDGDRQDRKLEKWRTIAIEAAKQCGNPWLPEIMPVQEFARFVGTSGRPPGVTATQQSAGKGIAAPLRLIASLHAGATKLRAAVEAYRSRHGAAPNAAVWLIGPEGDFSPAEIAAALAAGFAPITLGPLVLRSDTAATCALGILMNELRAAEG